MTNIIKALESERMKREVPEFGPGDTVVVEVRVKEGERERVQAYEGVVIAKGGLPADAARLLDEFLAEREGDEHG